MKLEIIKYEPETDRKPVSILFIHGAYHGAWCWKENFLPYFSSKGFASYAPSLRGHGGSEGKNRLSAFSLNDYLEDVLGVINGLDDKPVLVGHSMGGIIAQKIMCYHPEKIRAAVLISSAPHNGMIKDFLKSFIHDFSGMYAYLKKGNVDGLGRTFFSDTLSVDKRNIYLNLMQAESRKAMNELMKPIIKKAVNVSMPILLLGSKGDKCFSAKTIAAIGKFYKIEPIIFSDICHDMMLDPQWKTVADKIIEFIDRFILVGGC